MAKPRMPKIAWLQAVEVNIVMKRKYVVARSQVVKCNLESTRRSSESRRSHGCKGLNETRVNTAKID